MFKTKMATALGAIIVAASASALALSSAQAADLGEGSLKDTGPVYAAPVHVWTGFYAGVNVGYGWTEDQEIVYEYENEKKALAPYEISPDGGFIGGQIGYNFQRGSVVFGVEGDLQYSDIEDSGEGTGSIPVSGPTCCETDTTSLGADIDWFGTARARLGYAMDRTLVYVTGGFAFGEINIDNTYFFPGPGAGSQWPLQGESSTSETKTGYVIGGGIEHALSDQWSVKLGYQYIDLGEVDVSTTRVFENGNTADVPQMTEVDADFHTVRIGLNYKLSGPREPMEPLK